MPKLNKNASTFELPGLKSMSYDKAKDEVTLVISTANVSPANQKGFAAVAGSAFGTVAIPGMPKVEGIEGSWRLKLSVYIDTRSAEDKAFARAKKSGTPATMELE